GSAGRVTARFARDGSTLRFDRDAAAIAVTVCSSRIVRVERVSARRPGPSHVVTRDWPSTAFEIDDGDPVRVTTAHLRLEVESAPARLTFCRTEGAWLLRE